MAALANRAIDAMAWREAPITNVTVQPAAPAEVTLTQPITVQPAAPAEVNLTQPINIAPAEVTLTQPITVQPANAPDVHIDAPITVEAQPSMDVVIERDRSGNPTAFKKKPSK